jgi:hypothetical protein
VDATEKMIPRDRRYTRFDLEQIKYEVTRLKELYNKYVVPARMIPTNCASPSMPSV